MNKFNGYILMCVFLCLHWVLFQIEKKVVFRYASAWYCFCKINRRCDAEQVR